MLPLLLIALPLVAGLLLLMLPQPFAKWTAFVATLGVLGLTLFGAILLKTGSTLSYSQPWLPFLNARFDLAIDGISFILVLLTALLLPLIILVASRENYKSSFYALMLIMQSALMGVFMATDGFLFYIFWELALIPIYFICLGWGGENRNRITFKFFLYTMVGSLIMLFGLLYLYFQTPGLHSFSIQSLTIAANQLGSVAQNWVFWTFFLAFAIKIPVFPLHTWQPDTYTNAPTAGTMLLGGIMLKMGTYGIMRWLLPLVPFGATHYGPIVIGLCIVGIIYASLIAFAQQDFKRLIAYSSIAHVGLITAGLFAKNSEGHQGALYQMFAHGISVVGLFFVVDLIEKRKGTRDLSQLGGIRHQSPQFAWLFLILVLGSVALPLTAGFVGEFMLFIGIGRFNIWAAGLAGLTVILGAVYMLRSYQAIMLGEAPSHPFAPLTRLELFLLFTLAAMTLLFGLFPNWLLSISEPAVEALLEAARPKNNY